MGFGAGKTAPKTTTRARASTHPTRWRCAVHAYVLMTNHVHLLVTPQDREGISRLMRGMLAKALSQKH